MPIPVKSGIDEPITKINILLRVKKSFFCTIKYIMQTDAKCESKQINNIWKEHDMKMCLNCYTFCLVIYCIY